MTRQTEIAVPTSDANLNRIVVQLIATRDVVDWSLAAIIYAWTTGDDFQIDRTAVTKLSGGLRGFVHNPAKIYAYREAYDVAISEGLVRAVQKGDKIIVPTVKFSDYLKSTQWKIKQKSKEQSNARSRQQENLERDGHNPGVSKPATTSKRQGSGPRVSTVRERGERIVQELRAQVKQEQDVGRKAIWEATLSVALNALNSYTKANA